MFFNAFQDVSSKREFRFVIRSDAIKKINYYFSFVRVYVRFALVQYL